MLDLPRAGRVQMEKPGRKIGQVEAVSEMHAERMESTKRMAGFWTNVNWRVQPKGFASHLLASPFFPHFLAKFQTGIHVPHRLNWPCPVPIPRPHFRHHLHAKAHRRHFLPVAAHFLYSVRAPLPPIHQQLRPVRAAHFQRMVKRICALC